MKIGNYKVTSLVTSRFSLDGGSIFGIIPKSMWGKEVVPDKKNRIPLVTRSLLIRGNGKTILVDTGNGDKWDSKMKAILDTDPSVVNIQASLGELSVKPDEITDVICSHLHFDHAGGNTILDGGKVVPTFPNAKYWLQKSNWDWANSPTEKDKGSYRLENWEVLAENEMFTFLDGEEEFIAGIQIRITHGHTPGQMHPLLSDGKTTLFFGNDLFPTQLHFRIPCIMAFDNKPLKTLEEKKSVLNQAADENWIIVLPHDGKTEAVRLKRDGDKYAIEQIELDGGKQ